MRHRKIKGRLSRNISSRKALLKIMANDLFTYQRIETTVAKAKALKNFAEPLITLAKNNPDSIAARRQAFAKLCDKTVVKSLFDEIAPLYKEIPGGYTRILATRNRKGDGAPMAIMELTKRTISDNELLGIKEVVADTKKKAKKTTKKAKSEKGEEEKKSEVHHAAPDTGKEAKDERVIEKVKKEKAKSEDKKVAPQKGILKRFRRKAI